MCQEKSGRWKGYFLPFLMAGQETVVKKMRKCLPMYLVVYHFAHQGVQFEGKLEHLFN